MWLWAKPVCWINLDFYRTLVIWSACPAECSSIPEAAAARFELYRLCCHLQTYNKITHAQLVNTQSEQHFVKKHLWFVFECYWKKTTRWPCKSTQYIIRECITGFHKVNVQQMVLLHILCTTPDICLYTYSSYTYLSLQCENWMLSTLS